MSIEEPLARWPLQHLLNPRPAVLARYAAVLGLMGVAFILGGVTTQSTDAQRGGWMFSTGFSLLLCAFPLVLAATVPIVLLRRLLVGLELVVMVHAIFQIVADLSLATTRGVYWWEVAGGSIAMLTIICTGYGLVRGRVRTASSSAAALARRG